MQTIIERIPESLQEFETLAGAQRTPERICALFLCANEHPARPTSAETAGIPQPIRLRVR